VPLALKFHRRRPVKPVRRHAGCITRSLVKNGSRRQRPSGDPPAYPAGGNRIHSIVLHNIVLTLMTKGTVHEIPS
jgi:hypothetical protein